MTAASGPERHDRGPCRVMLFLKAPRRGQVKTRLAKGVGDEAAAALYRHFALDVLALMGNGNRQTLICYDPPDAWDEIREWLGAGYEAKPQRGRDLGERMRTAFETAFDEGVHRALLVGTDLPDLPPGIIEKADEALRSADAVVGPTKDGGYYLIGFNRDGFEPAVFGDVPWSTEQVFRMTSRILAQKKRRLETLPAWQDVDDLADLMDLIRRAKTHERASHTRRCLERLGMKMVPGKKT